MANDESQDNAQSESADARQLSIALASTRLPEIGMQVTERPTAQPDDLRQQETLPVSEVSAAPQAARQAVTARARPGAQRAARHGQTMQLESTGSASNIAHPDDEDDLRAGMSIHKYQLIRELGRGGMGAVFLARDTRLGRLVAIKVLHIHGDQFNKRFIAEARTTAKCAHENIVVLYEADEFQGLPYMVLEYLEGQSLRQIMDRRAGLHAHDDIFGDTAGDISGDTVGDILGDASGRPRLMSVERAVELARPVLRALACAHGMGIVHRDLKPANIMVTADGKVKVLDFGIAKILAEQDRVSPGEHSAVYGQQPLLAQPSSGIMGTLPYMSPEQLCAADIDARTDIWALGVMLFEMVTGHHPLAPLSAPKLDRLARGAIDMPRVSEIRPDLDKLAGIIDRCLIRDKDDRIATARELLAELDALAPDRHSADLDADQSPFAGLAAFQESDAGRFFGRADDTANLVNLVRSQPLIAVAGPSGVGKSSLVRAGVIPALKRLGEGWDSVVIRPGRAPLNALADIASQFAQSLSADQSASTASTARSGPGAGAPLGDYLDELIGDRPSLRQRLIHEPGYLGTSLRAWAQRKRRRILIFVDQFEELYTAVSDPEERTAFLACLRSMADDASSPLRVMLSIRSDFLERLAEDRAFMAVAMRGLFLLPAMHRGGLREALVKPVEAMRYRFEDEDMVASMLQDLEQTRGALPLLQFAAAHLWEERDRTQRLLTRASFEDMGGIAGVLARHADAVLARMTVAQARIARGIFERLVSPERTRAVASMADVRALPGDMDEIEHVLHALAAARLLIIQVKSESASTDASLLMAADEDEDNDDAVEIAHESLIASWPTLRRWLDENQDDAVFVARLRTAAKQWEQNERSEGMLWRGQPAAEAERWQELYAGELSGRELSYLDAVYALSRRAQRRRRRLIYAGMAVFVLLVLAGGFAVIKGQNEAVLTHSLAEEKQARGEAQNANDALAAAKLRAEQQAEQARAAQAAEAEAKEKAKERAEDAKVAEAEARNAEAEARAAEADVKAANARIVELFAEAQNQRERALAEAEKARQAQQDAEDARQEAERLRQEAEKVRDEVKDKNRIIQELIERQGITDVTLPDEDEIEPAASEKDKP